MTSSNICALHRLCKHKSSERPSFRKKYTFQSNCDNATREPSCFAAVSFFFLQREISAISLPIAAKLCHMIGNECNCKNYICPKFGGPPPKKIWGRTTCLLARFRTTSHFNREYLWNGTRYRQSENGVANYDLSRVC